MWSSAVAQVAGCFPFSALPPSGRGPGASGPTQHSGCHLPVLTQGWVSGTTPPPSLYDVQEQAHTPSTYITGPLLAAQDSRNEVFIRSSPVPTKSQRLHYSRKEVQPWGTPHRCCLRSASPSAHRPADLQTGGNGEEEGTSPCKKVVTQSLSYLLGSSWDSLADRIFGFTK